MNAKKTNAKIGGEKSLPKRSVMTAPKTGTIKKETITKVVKPETKPTKPEPIPIKLGSCEPGIVVQIKGKPYLVVAHLENETKTIEQFTDHNGNTYGILRETLPDDTIVEI